MIECGLVHSGPSKTAGNISIAIRNYGGYRNDSGDEAWQLDPREILLIRLAVHQLHLSEDDQVVAGWEAGQVGGRVEDVGDPVIMRGEKSVLFV